MNTDCNCSDYLENNFQSLKAKIVVKQKEKQIQIKQGIQLFVDQLKTQQKSTKTMGEKITQINNAKND